MNYASFHTVFGLKLFLMHQAMDRKSEVRLYSHTVPLNPCAYILFLLSKKRRQNKLVGSFEKPSA